MIRRVSALGLLQNLGHRFAMPPPRSGLRASPPTSIASASPRFFSRPAASSPIPAMNLTPTVSVERLRALTDNYIFVVRDHARELTWCVDPGEPGAVLELIETKGWSLDFILVTHHHNDHTGGVAALKSHTKAVVLGAEAGRNRIPTMDIGLSAKHAVLFSQDKSVRLVPVSEQAPMEALRMRVFEVPGHTKDHVAFWFKDLGAAFVGDTLFSAGCGRLFEGTPAQMTHSLAQLCLLPPQTLLFCAHEYTLSNLRFAQSLINAAQSVPSYKNSRDVVFELSVKQRTKEALEIREKGLPTIPTTIADEMSYNPFLKLDSPTLHLALQSLNRIQGNVGDEKSADEIIETFAQIRQLKDKY